MIIRGYKVKIMCISKLLQKWKEGRMAKNTLDKTIHELEREADSLKASQIIGYDDSKIYKYEGNSISFTASGYFSKSYYLKFTTTQAFPLVAMLCKVYENGVLKSEPKNIMASNMGLTTDSVGEYTLGSLHATIPTQSSPSVSYPDNVVLNLLDIYAYGNLTGRVDITILSSCPGILQISEVTYS